MKAFSLAELCGVRSRETPVRLEFVAKSGTKYVTEIETELSPKDYAELTYGKILEARNHNVGFYIRDTNGDSAIVIDPNEIEGVVCASGAIETGDREMVGSEYWEAMRMSAKKPE